MMTPGSIATAPAAGQRNITVANPIYLMYLAQKTLLPLALLALHVGVPVASAHPGHSLDAYGPGHLLTSPYHVGFLVVAAAALLTGGWLVKRRLPRRVLQVCGVVALVAAGMAWIAS